MSSFGENISLDKQQCFTLCLRITSISIYGGELFLGKLRLVSKFSNNMLIPSRQVLV